MKKSVKLPVIIILLFFIVVTGYSLQENKTAPAFSGTSFDGKVYKLSDFAGKVVIIDFFASWCNPCKRSMPYLSDLYTKMKDSGVVIIGINLDKKDEDAKKFLTKLNKDVSFPIIWDKEGKIPTLYSVEAMPTTLIIDKNGKIRLRETGFSDEHITKYNQTIEILLKEKLYD